MKASRALVFLPILLFFSGIAAPAQSTGKNPVIIIPGISGSQLVNAKTGKTVWFSIKRDKDDDLRLPMTSSNLALNRDNLRATDIIREIKLPVLPDVEVYQTLIDALKERGYSEGDWNKPKATDVFYVFAYDWRRDNVEAARQLMQKIERAKRALGKPDLKFDILAHSMGGLIARYAAMYGTADLPRQGFRPTWAGASSINKLMLFGTPNEGSMSAFEVINEGYPIIASRKLPLVDDLRAEDVVSSPAVFQLLPHSSAGHFFDEQLKPISVDLYDIDTWTKYGWGPLTDPKFLSKLKDAPRLALTNKEIKPVSLNKDASADDRLLARTTYAQVLAYFKSALDRARRFHAALDVPVEKVPIQVYAYGGNCEQTLDGVILIRDEKKNTWNTIFDAKDLKSANGEVIKKEQVKAAMFGIGDGRVTQRSLLATFDASPGSENAVSKTIFPLADKFLACGTHTKLFLEKPIKDSFLSALVVEKQKQP